MPNADGTPPAANAPEPLEPPKGSPTDGQGKWLVKLWEDRIKTARDLREDKEKDWSRWSNEAAGIWEENDDSGDFVYVNRPFSIIRTVVSQTYARNPKAKVVPRKPDLDEAAEDQTHLLNQIADTIGVKNEGLRATHESQGVAGHSWLKTFWRPNIVPVQQPPALALSPEGLPTLIPQPPVPIDYGLPVVRHFCAGDVLPDPEAQRKEDFRWIAHRIVRPTKAIKEDTRYKNTENLKATKTTDGAKKDGTRYADSQGGINAQDTDRTVLWEIEDFEHKRFVTIAEGHPLPLRDEPDDYVFLGGLGMWTMMEGDINLFSPDGVGILGVIEPIAQEHNVLRTRQLNHTKRALAKVLAKKGSFDSEEDKDDLISGDDFAVVQVNDLDAVRVLDMPNLPMDNRIAETNLKTDEDEQAGSSAFQRGTSASGSDTATEAAIIGQNDRIASSARVERVEAAIREVYGKILKLCRKNMKTEQTVRILGKDGSIAWRSLTPSDIADEFDVDIEYGSSVFRDELENRQQAMNLYNLSKDDPILNPIKVRKDLLIAFGKGEELGEYLNPQIMQALAIVLAQMAPPTPSGGPSTPIPGVPSAKPSGLTDRLKAGVPPEGGINGPSSALPSMGQLRAAALGTTPR